MAAVGWGTVLCWMGAARQLALLSWQRRADGAGSLRELRQLHLAAQLSCISLAPSCDEEGDAHLPPRACVVCACGPSHACCVPVCVCVWAVADVCVGR